MSQDWQEFTNYHMVTPVTFSEVWASHVTETQALGLSASSCEEHCTNGLAGTICNFFLLDNDVCHFGDILSAPANTPVSPVSGGPWSVFIDNGK